jgi:hypothetical protein
VPLPYTRLVGSASVVPVANFGAAVREVGEVEIGGLMW